MPVPAPGSLQVMRDILRLPSGYGQTQVASHCRACRSGLVKKHALCGGLFRSSSALYRYDNTWAYVCQTAGF